MFSVLDITTGRVVCIDSDPILALRQAQKDLAEANERFQELESEAATLELELAVEKTETKKLQDLVDTNIKERDILATEKAELRQKLADSEEICKRLRERLTEEKGVTDVWVRAANDERDNTARLRDEISELKKRLKKALDQRDGMVHKVKALESENFVLKSQNTPVRVNLMGDMCFGSIRDSSENKLKEENASLKLEVDKLKGLIVEARKYVATANLMLA